MLGGLLKFSCVARIPPPAALLGVLVALVVRHVLIRVSLAELAVHGALADLEPVGLVGDELEGAKALPASSNYMPWKDGPLGGVRSEDNCNGE